MTSRPDHSKMSEAEARARAGGWPVTRFLFSFFVIFLAGFAWFASQLRSEESKPDRHADGIVVLTGGASRVADALDLLSKGYGKRLLISSVSCMAAAYQKGGASPRLEGTGISTILAVWDTSFSSLCSAPAGPYTIISPNSPIVRPRPTSAHSPFSASAGAMAG